MIILRDEFDKVKPVKAGSTWRDTEKSCNENWAIAFIYEEFDKT